MRLRRNRTTTTTEGTGQMPAPPRTATEGPHSLARRTGLAALATLAIAAVTASSALALPAGRAYELVTPRDKGGQSAIGEIVGGLGLAAPDGDSIAFPVLGAFPGAVGNSYPDPYLSTRGWPAWGTEHVGPPRAPSGDAGSTARVSGVSEDLSRMIVTSNVPLTPDAWEPNPNNKFEQPFYVRDNADGSLRLLTPVPVDENGDPDPDAAPYLVVFVWGSADYSHVLFETDAVLTEDAPASGRKLYQWADGVVTLASVTDAGPVAGVGGTGSNISTVRQQLNENIISRDGEAVWFSSPANPQGSRMYRREGGESVEVTASENPAEPAPADDAIYYGATPDGSKMVFSTESSLVEGDVVPPSDPGQSSAIEALDLYMYTHSDDPASDSNLTLLSENIHPDTEVLGVFGMSENGSRVYFAARDGANADRDPTVRLYLWDGGDLQEIGTAAEEAAFAAAESGGALPWLQNSMKSARPLRDVSADGSAFAVTTTAQLDPSRDTGGTFQVMRYGVGEGWTCVSCPPDGSSAGADARLNIAAEWPGVAWDYDRRNLSDDGDVAFFESEEALLPAEDSNGGRDVYMWQGGELSLISGGRSEDPSYFMDASANGDSVFFLTWDQLSGWDDDLLSDVYVARAGGGLPQPPEPPAPCVGDQCQGQLSGAPVFNGPASVRFEELGDIIAGPPRSLRIRRVTAKQRARLARGRRVGLRVLVGRPGVVRVAVRARVGRRLRIVARGRARAPEAGTVWVRVRLSKPARRVLARGRRLGLRMVARSTGASEADRVRVRVKRPAKRGPRRTAGGRR